MRKRLTTLAASLILAAPRLSSADFNFGDLRQYNAVVVNNISNSTSEIEGPTLVGGNITGNAMNFAKNLNSSYNGTNTVIVGGNFSVNNPAVPYGNIYVKAAANAPTAPQFGGTNPNGKVVTGLDTHNLSMNIQSALNSASANLEALHDTTNAQTIANPSSGMHVTLDASRVNANGVAVFNIAGSLLSGSNIQEFDLANSSKASTIVINVSGTGTITDQVHVGGEFTDSSTINQKVIYNFYQASVVNLQVAIDGAVLAPTADLTQPQTINGAVFVQQYEPGGEIHLPYETSSYKPGDPLYAGVGFTAAVPEPATVISTLTGLGMVGFTAWRRRRRRTA